MMEDQFVMDDVVEEQTADPIITYMKKHTIQEMIPVSGKVIVLNSKLNLESAYVALKENGVKCGVVWNGKEYIGMFDVYDIIRVVTYYYSKGKSKSLIPDLKRPIEEWKEELCEMEGKKGKFVTLRPEDSLFEASKRLKEEGIRRIPIIDEESKELMYIITHSRILRYVWSNKKEEMEKMPIFQRGIYELAVGTYEQVATALCDTSFETVLQMIIQRNLSAVPIVSAEGKLISKFVKSDILHLPPKKLFFELDKKTKEVFLDEIGERKIVSIERETSLYKTIELFCESRYYTLLCVDPAFHINGVIAQSDVFRLLLPTPSQ